MATCAQCWKWTNAGCCTLLITAGALNKQERVPDFDPDFQSQLLSKPYFKYPNDRYGVRNDFRLSQSKLVVYAFQKICVTFKSSINDLFLPTLFQTSVILS